MNNLNLEPLRELALDVWEDLGRTRLAGVAVGLSLALLAIMVIVLRPAGPPEIKTNPAFASATPPAAGEVAFAVPGDEPLKFADVDLSAPRDPFRSLDGLAGADDQTLLPASDEVQDTLFNPGSGGGGGAPAGASGYSDADALMPLDDLSGPAPAPAADSDREPSGAIPADDTSDEPEKAPVTDYTYTADIQFGRVDDLKRYSRVQRLGLIPSRRLPLLMYLGVTRDHSTAVFMVDSRLSQGGEGRCVPKDELCTFLELRPQADQDEHHFRDADGNEYLLRLRRLVRTTATAGSLAGRDVSALRDTPPVVDGAR